LTKEGTELKIVLALNPSQHLRQGPRFYKFV
jgi:hypothetical protein